MSTKYSSTDFNWECVRWQSEQFELSEFDKELRSKWVSAMKNGFFRYKLDKLPTRIVPGKRHYVTQLNILRAQQRRKPQNVQSLNQPFDSSLFNFTKIHDQEILLRLWRQDQPDTGVLSENREFVEEKTHCVIINVSPLEFGNVLIVPNIDACNTQITKEGLTIAIETLLLSKHCGFRIGFNSLCAFASVNHEHYHAYYLEHELLVESCAVKHVYGFIFELRDWPALGFVFQLRGNKVQHIVRLLCEITRHFQETETAHNLFITRGTVFDTDKKEETTVRIFLWPRKKFIGSKCDENFNVAVVELAGHIPIKIERDFETLTEEMIDDRIHCVSLSNEEFTLLKQQVVRLCKGLF